MSQKFQSGTENITELLLKLCERKEERERERERA
jgi:hypothetical protein